MNIYEQGAPIARTRQQPFIAAIDEYEGILKDNKWSWRYIYLEHFMNTTTKTKLKRQYYDKR